ncbi:hypothetical protein MRB53_002334 [Persea americana]|uniref:Uncharacterized protein n=1 Tax=Persea americana TaxID=3435 RepID=A0ACC2MV39_PERAE|nr:hypothetical protein MRB53_002334 [Persea americana]
MTEEMKALEKNTKWKSTKLLEGKKVERRRCRDNDLREGVFLLGDDDGVVQSLAKIEGGGAVTGAGRRRTSRCFIKEEIDKNEL